MLYIWLDESTKEGEYYSNFYGGIMIDSRKLNDVLLIMRRCVEENGLSGHEIKWQKVNENHFEPYKKVVDTIFDLLQKGLIKMRIFFKSNQYDAIGLTKEQKIKTYQMLYYQFVKHAFGLKFANSDNSQPLRVHLSFDEMPLCHDDISEFRNSILGLNNVKEFSQANIRFSESDIIEADSRNELPLQFLDLILGAMSFRLNNKHLIIPEGSRVRGKRTRIKEKLYKYINQRIREIMPGFNIGISTGRRSDKDVWTDPYRHWSFVPTNFIRDLSKAKKHK